MGRRRCSTQRTEQPAVRDRDILITCGDQARECRTERLELCEFGLDLGEVHVAIRFASSRGPSGSLTANSNSARTSSRLNPRVLLSERASERQRVYGEDDLARLVFVGRCCELGFPLERVRSLVALIEDRGRSCLEARDLAREHLLAVRAKLDELRALAVEPGEVIPGC